MAIHLAALTWALIFILRLCFPPGKSIAKVITTTKFNMAPDKELNLYIFVIYFYICCFLMFGNTLIALRTRDAEKHHISHFCLERL